MMMLIEAKELRGYTLHSLDGEIGKSKEFYFDDHHWTIRYLVVDTGNWLTGMQVLISPYALRAVDRAERCISVNLTRKQIEDSPSLDSDKPVSRQFEEDYHGYYGWPAYWGGSNMWGYYPYIIGDPKQWTESPPAHREWDPHLRSTHDVSGHDVQASDGEIGHVEDFVVDEETWAIRYLIINTGPWWSGRRVLVSPRWIECVDWTESKVFINLSQEAVKHSPEYTHESLLTRDYESGLHQHYNRQGYWIDESSDLEKRY